MRVREPDHAILASLLFPDIASMLLHFIQLGNYAIILDIFEDLWDTICCLWRKHDFSYTKEELPCITTPLKDFLNIYWMITR